MVQHELLEWTESVRMRSNTMFYEMARPESLWFSTSVLICLFFLLNTQILFTFDANILFHIADNGINVSTWRKSMCFMVLFSCIAIYIYFTWNLAW